MLGVNLTAEFVCACYFLFMRTNPSITGQARRAQIIAAAARVIAREGLAQASFGRIAAEAGVSSPGMISYHFTGRDELLAVLCDTFVADCAATIDTAVSDAAASNAGAPVDALAAYLTAFIRWQDTHRDEVGALWRLAAGWKRPGAAAAFDEAPLRDPLVRILTQGRRAGTLRKNRPEWTVETILCAVEGFHQVLADDPAVDAEAFSASLVDLFTDGLRA